MKYIALHHYYLEEKKIIHLVVIWYKLEAVKVL